MIALIVQLLHANALSSPLLAVISCTGHFVAMVRCVVSLSAVDISDDIAIFQSATAPRAGPEIPLGQYCKSRDQAS